MIVSVESTDLGWLCAAATFAASFRGQKPFQYEDVFTTDNPLASDTKMNGFLDKSLGAASLTAILHFDFCSL
jgi:hypothetical protein